MHQSLDRRGSSRGRGSHYRVRRVLRCRRASRDIAWQVRTSGTRHRDGPSYCAFTLITTRDGARGEWSNFSLFCRGGVIKPGSRCRVGECAWTCIRRASAGRRQLGRSCSPTNPAHREMRMETMGGTSTLTRSLGTAAVMRLCRRHGSADDNRCRSQGCDTGAALLRLAVSGTGRLPQTGPARYTMITLVGAGADRSTREDAP